MSDEKSKKPLKLKTLDDIKHDASNEIHIFSKKRRPQTKPGKIVDEDNIEDQVRKYVKIIIQFRFLIRLLQIRIMVKNPMMILQEELMINQYHQVVKKDKNNERFNIKYLLIFK